MAKEKLVEKKQPIDGHKKPYVEPRFWRFGRLCNYKRIYLVFFQLPAYCLDASFDYFRFHLFCLYIDYQ